MIRWLRSACTLSVVLTIWSPDPAHAGSKPFEPPGARAVRTPSCVVGPTINLCVPLDDSFDTVVFDGDGGAGEADADDPCQRNDDDVTTEIALPFVFSFYGSSYTSVFLNNNGTLSFGDAVIEFSPSGFPFAGEPMIAPFWGDVDTRDVASGVVHYKVEAHRLIVTWDHVGYYLGHGNLRNTFQVILSDGTDPVVGAGNNVCFCYGDMQWTTGDASGGIGGFGGAPATAGINKGDGTTHAVIGRFDHAGSDYDGPGGNADGVSYLDNQRFCFDVQGGTGGTNIAPVAQGFPAANLDTACVGDTLLIATSFASPEVGQNTTVTIDLMGLPNATIVSNAAGNPATQIVDFRPVQSQVGDHVIRYTAVDSGSPALTTIVDLTVRVVTDCQTATVPTTWGSLKSRYR
jgi:hypothetical protein